MLYRSCFGDVLCLFVCLCVFLCSFFVDVLSVNHFALRLRTR